MSKPKARPSPTSVSGLIKPDVIRVRARIRNACDHRLTRSQDVADSLGIPAVSEVVSSALASDVEYRIHQVVDVGYLSHICIMTPLNQFKEAARFMRHARRTVLTTSDIEQALRVLNIEPLYGHSPHAPLTFRRAPPAGGASQTGAVFFVEDEEIEFERTVREYKIAVPRPTRWTAHWLAVEGVQPLIPENPPAIPRESDAPPDGTKGALAGARAPAATATVPGSGGPHAVSTQALTAGKTQHLQQQQLVKQVLSRELQLYYTRLTSSLLPGQPGTPAGAEEAKRDAALASVRHDAGLQALVPYLVRWVGEGVVALLKTSETSRTDADGTTLATYMDVISALLGNSTLFVEPYVRSTRKFPPRLTTYGRCAAASTPSAGAVHSSACGASRDTCSPSTCTGGGHGHGRAQATLGDVSVTRAADHEDSPPRADLPWKKQGDPRGRRTRTSGSWQGSHPEGSRRMWWGARHCG
jgi:transcription initiation factor TFIID subunit 6